METYNEAITYPNCLRFGFYMRYIVMPTFCYQLKYPLADKINWKAVGYRLG